MNIDESQSIIRLDYKDWKIVAQHQCHIHPYKEFVAIVTKEFNNTIMGFNKEGNSLGDAVANAIKEIERRNGKT